MSSINIINFRFSLKYCIDQNAFATFWTVPRTLSSTFSPKSSLRSAIAIATWYSLVFFQFNLCKKFFDSGTSAGFLPDIGSSSERLSRPKAAWCCCKRTIPYQSCWLPKSSIVRSAMFISTIEKSPIVLWLAHLSIVKARYHQDPFHESDNRQWLQPGAQDLLRLEA